MKIVSTMIEAHIFRESGNGIEFLLLKRADNQFTPVCGKWLREKLKRMRKHSKQHLEK